MRRVSVLKGVETYVHKREEKKKIGTKRDHEDILFDNESQTILQLGELLKLVKKLMYFSSYFVYSR